MVSYSDAAAHPNRRIPVIPNRLTFNPASAAQQARVQLLLDLCQQRSARDMLLLRRSFPHGVVAEAFRRGPVSPALAVLAISADVHGVLDATLSKNARVAIVDGLFSDLSKHCSRFSRVIAFLTITPKLAWRPLLHEKCAAAINDLSSRHAMGHSLDASDLLGKRSEPFTYLVAAAWLATESSVTVSLRGLALRLLQQCTNIDVLFFFPDLPLDVIQEATKNNKRLFDPESLLWVRAVLRDPELVESLMKSVPHDDPGVLTLTMRLLGPDEGVPLARRYYREHIAPFPARMRALAETMRLTSTFLAPMYDVAIITSLLALPNLEAAVRDILLEKLTRVSANTSLVAS
jgi:hypothetical protein